MNRRVYFLIILLLSVICFSNGRQTEIADRIMVQAIGIDNCENGYKVTMQIFTPDGSGSETSIDPSKPNISIAQGKGATVNEAVKKCMSTLGGDLFIGQNQIILFGHDVDLSDRNGLFSFFLSSSQAFLNVDCAAAENTAEEILKIPITESTIASEKYPQMISTSADMGRCIKVVFTDLLDAVESKNSCIILPVFSATESESSSSGDDSSEEQIKSTALDIRNGAVYVNGKYSAEINIEQMGYASVLGSDGKAVHTDIRYKDESLSKTFKVLSKETRAEMKDGEIIFTVTVSLAPKDAQMFDRYNKREHSNEEAKKLIQKKMQSFADEMCTSHSAELVNADRLLKRYYPDIFRQYADNPSALYAHTRIKVRIK